MERIIKSDPAPYPQTSTPEIKAVIKFVSILDGERVKPDVKFLDKIPNTDGIIEIVTQSQIPIGKLDVQIKFLYRRNYLTPKYQCKKDFLAYCEQSILPVLLIVVDTINSIAYWQHIDKSTILDLSKKIKKKTVNLDFKIENQIKENNNSYVQKWIEIIEEYQEKLYDYDSIKKRNETLDFELNELKSITNTAIGKNDPIFREIHIFLDFYNGLLDNDFITVKNILYPNYWKIGLGIYEYLETSTSFSMYPISYSSNDVLIKQYNSEDQFYLQKILRHIGHNFKNPIKERPKQYAYELIENDTNRILEKQPLIVKDQFLANEYILAFIDKFYIILGLEINVTEYLITEIEFSLNTFLPLWAEQSIEDAELKNTNEHRKFVLDLDFIFIFTYPDRIKNISQKVKDEIIKGVQPSIKLEITSTDFNIQILLNLLAYIRQIGIEKIEREYQTKHQVNKTSYSIWEAFGEEKTENKVKVFYSHFIRIYDLLVDTYFPNLKSELQFYNDFNLLVIVFDFSRASINYSPSIEYYYLKSNTHTENRTIIYGSKDNNTLFKREKIRDYFTNNLEIDGISYRLTSCSLSILDFIYKKTPMLDSINGLLKDRLKVYFEKKTTPNT